ncbi:MAG: hypothetical protein Q8P22_10435 [Chloroflexota bacterium]|nr:hypothetical protein [Chloroflexota bacterium]
MAAQQLYRKRARVAIPCREQWVWHAAIARVLQGQPHLEVVMVPPQDEACLAEIGRLQPDWVILLSEQSCVNYSPGLVDIFSVAPSTRVIVLCHCDNKIRMYHSEETVMTEAQEFIDLICRPAARAEAPTPRTAAAKT